LDKEVSGLRKRLKDIWTALFTKAVVQREVLTNRESIPVAETKKRKRERLAIFGLGVFFCLLTYVEIHLSNMSQKLPFVNSIFFFGLVNFNVALLLFLAFLIFRNFVKIFSERRGGLLGSRLKTKLVMAFVTFAFVPTALLFLVSVFYINSSFDKWFSLKIGSVLQDSLEVTNAYYSNSKKKNYFFAHRIAEQIANTTPLRRPAVLAKLRKDYSLDALEFYPSLFEDRSVYLSSDNELQSVPQATLELLQKGITQGIEASTIHSFANGNLIRCIVPVRLKNSKQIGALVVSSYIPLSLVSKMDGIANAYEDYRDVNPLKYPIKSIYMIILVLVTLLIFFGASWFGFHLARQLSTPLEILGKAAEDIASGRYQTVDVRVGSQEVFQLVESFNKMIRDLSVSEKQVHAHNRYREVLLSNISAGVISIDQEGCITTINKYASRLLGVEPAALIGKHFGSVLAPEYQALFEDLLQKIHARNASSIQKDIQVSLRGENLVLQTTLSPLKDESGQGLGYVLVFDDLTKLIHAQRAAAWREVARRIAHEIKNPLTPIRLSAERLQKKFAEKVNDPTFEICTQTIVQQVEALKQLVNEFSSFARLPQAVLTPNDLNKIIEEALVLYKEGHRNIVFQVKLDPSIPKFDMDALQIKRVMINLFENAVAAVSGRKDPSIAISTQYDSVLKIVRCNVSDNGPGIQSEIRDRIFEPYFSTREGGTGLGLAIAKRIIDDHNGFIRVFKNSPTGIRFTFELPAVTSIAATIETKSEDFALEEYPPT
jgi:two-component system nitrogen regulation sensor histidine kinase NtrY